VVSVDVLTDVLQTVRVKTACYGRLEASAPWGIKVPDADDAKFHVVLEGDCLLEMNGAQPIALTGGDLVMLPHGHEHILKDAHASEVIELDSLLSCNDGSDKRQPARQLRVGGEGPLTTLVSGRISFEDRRNNPLLAVLPPVIPLLGEAGRSVPWLESTLQFIACEAAARRPGAQTVISRLADILFIQIVRGHLAALGEAAGDGPGWLGALAEPQIGAALSLVHQRPEQSWTVASLAQRVGMSRSAFASRFTRLVGEPPLHYVTRWRMQKAAGLLREGRSTLAEIAEQVGYESETAFSKAFKRAVGSSPGAYRRAARNESRSEAA
jgi:AraC-like DNA-binding protein